MGSQFVDLNADGHLDYISATFDGSAHVSYGSKDGFDEPQLVNDSAKDRVIVSTYWCYEGEDHIDTGRSLPDGKGTGERCISALGFDWDNDGDYDLLLGTYEGGHLYRQMNEGTKTEPKFTGMNIPVMAGDVAFALPAKMTTPKLVDWDADGDLDLVAGSYSDPYAQEGEGGGIYLSINDGKVGAPSFGALTPIISPVERGGAEPQRPDIGVYPDVLDYDGDGDLDIVAGGYSMWTPEGRKLNAEEEARAAELSATVKRLNEESRALFEKIWEETFKATVNLDPESEEHEEIVDSINDKYESESTASRERLSAAQAELEELVPSPKRVSYVWLYERL